MNHQTLSAIDQQMIRYLRLNQPQNRQNNEAAPLQTPQDICLAVTNLLPDTDEQANPEKPDILIEKEQRMARLWFSQLEYDE